MIPHYFRLALMRLRRNVWLTTLIVLAIAVGIGSSMTVFTVLYTLAADPMPWKSSHLFAPVMDTNDPRRPRPTDYQAYISAGLFSYPDAMSITATLPTLRRAAMFSVSQVVRNSDPTRLPVAVEGQATQSDFFSMFDVPFLHGSAWGRAEDESRANVVVISKAVAAHFFPGTNPVGRAVQLGIRDFRIVGVTDDWAPFPAFYDPLGVTDAVKVRNGPQIFLPIRSAVQNEFPPTGFVTATVIPQLSLAPKAAPKTPTLSNMQIYYSCPCFLQTQLWVELGGAADAQRYRQALDGYAEELRQHGGFTWKPTTALHSMREWLLLSPQTASMRREFGLAAWVALGFLLVCLANAGALMLARFSRRSGELAVRRALGAPRRALMAQCLVESGLIAILGGLLGLLITLAGLQLERASVPREMIRAVHPDWQLMAATVAVAMLVGIAAGLYPAWHASRVRGGLELKSL